MEERLHVAVIGAGIVGTCTAIALLDEGCRVTLIDAATPGGEQAASYGNGAFISPNSIIPMSMPGLWKKVPGFLLDRTGPLVIRWSAFPGMLPWLLRFLLSGLTERRASRTASALSTLLHDAPDCHVRLAEQAGLSRLIRRDGLLFAYRSRADFEADGLAWRLRRENGVQWQELDRAAIAEREPGLSPAYTFAALVTDGAHCTSPGQYVSGLAGYAASRGAALVTARATGLRQRDGHLLGVETSAGFIACDRAVIAAGIASQPLARQVGDRIPMAAERGYHVQLELEPSDAGPRAPVMPADGRMANTWLDEGLRASGQVELAASDAAPDWGRADILLNHLFDTWPGLPRDARVRRWRGSRPSTPDGLPVIARASGCADVVHAFGHGHIGLASGPRTGTIVAALIAGHQPPIDTAPFAATRF